MTSNARFLLTTRQAYETVTKLAGITVDSKLGISSAQYNATLGTGGGAFFAQAGSAKFARQQVAATLAHYFATIMTLFHVFAVFAQEGIAAIADSNLMVGLKFMAPVTIDAYKGMACIAADLHFVDFVTVQTGFGCCHR